MLLGPHGDRQKSVFNPKHYKTGLNLNHSVKLTICLKPPPELTDVVRVKTFRASFISSSCYTQGGFILFKWGSNFVVYSKGFFFQFRQQMSVSEIDMFPGSVTTSTWWSKASSLMQIIRDKHFASKGCVASLLRQCFKFNVAHQKNTHMIKAVIPPPSSQFEMHTVDLYVSHFILGYIYNPTGTAPVTRVNAYCMPHRFMTQVLKAKWPILFVGPDHSKSLVF